MPSALTDIRDQETAITGLLNLLRRRAIPQAMLFTGIDGIGKGTAARRFAMAVNCDRRADQEVHQLPCGACRNCRRIVAGHHPDILHLAPRGAFMRIDQIRALCDTLALKPYEAGTRLAILQGAQSLNPEAGNALLKILEEPPEGTILILTAPQTSDLLPTIVSRCRRVRFNPLRQETIAALLTARKDIDPALAATIAAMARGSYSRAAAMATGDWADRRHWVLAGIGLLEPAAAGGAAVGRLLAFAEQLVKAKSHLEDSLELIKSWLRDLAVIQHAPDKVLHQDLMANLAAEKLALTERELVARYDAVEAAQRALRGNANRRLCIETLVLRLNGLLPATPLRSL
ncbi:MAG: DNA polymerase III subunit delta' [Desulfosarcinaceae bacterium]|nr:DNA polymerase III subunit delta' [Desulfosarcinaceae bacterium]